MHGTTAAVYVQPDKEGDLWQPLNILDEELKDGHALACADYLGVGSDQIVVGWRRDERQGDSWNQDVHSTGKRREEVARNKNIC